MEVTTVLLCILAALAAYLIFRIRELLNYWKKRGIFHDEPHFLLGNMKGTSMSRHLVDPMWDVYRKYKNTGPFCGFYFFLRPAVVLLDLDLVKKVMIKDFNNFVDRGNFYNERDDPLSAHLFSLDGSKWRHLRNKLSPTFTSGKMKFMFNTVLDVCHRFAETFGEEIDKNGAEIEIKDINARFTTDVIGTCAFGIECNSLKDPNAEFRSYGRKIADGTRYPKIVIGIIHSFPKLSRSLRMKVTRSDIEDFFMSVVKETVEYRERENIKRNDFMDILIELKNNKKTEDGKIISGLTIEEIAAQAFVFFLAGFDTSSQTMSHAMFEMAFNSKIQEKVRIEVNEVLKKHNGVLTYESLGELHYLEQVIDETLRKYPILSFLQRRAKDDYDTGDPKYKIEKGTIVFIPVEPIHHDPEIFPNPMVFDPERFTPEEKQKLETCAYLPFGEGPRNCIGLRFGKMQTKIGLALMIKNFRFSVSERTTVPLKFDPKQFLKTSIGGIYLKAERV